MTLLCSVGLSGGLDVTKIMLLCSFGLDGVSGCYQYNAALQLWIADAVWLLPKLCCSAATVLRLSKIANNAVLIWSGLSD
jgi:hypothetical protein